MKTLPSSPLLLPLSTFLLIAFLFTATALPSLLLFGYREVLIGVVIDKLIKFASFLRTLGPKETTVSYFWVVTAVLGCRIAQPCRPLYYVTRRRAWPGPNFTRSPTISDLGNIINYLRTQHKANTSSIRNAFNPLSPQNAEKYWLFTLKITWLTGSCVSLQPPNITTELDAKYLNLAKDHDSKYSSTEYSFLHHVKSKKCKATHHESRTTWLGEVGSRIAKHVCQDLRSPTAPHAPRRQGHCPHWTLQSCAGRGSQDSGTKNSQLTMLFIPESPKADWTSSLVLPALHLRLFSSPLLLQSRQ